jgi:hypothetical protein
MKQITYICNRCGNAILENRTIVKIKAGKLGSQHDEPLDICGDCQSSFTNWLRGGAQNVHNDVGAIGAVVLNELPCAIL